MGIQTTQEKRSVTVDVITAVCDGCGTTHEMLSGVMPDHSQLDQGERNGWTTLAHAPGASVHLMSARNRSDYALCGDCMERVSRALDSLHERSATLQED